MAATVLVAGFLGGCGSDSSTSPSEESYTSINIVVKDEFDRAVVGAILTTNPPTAEKITDETGHATFEDILVREYTFYLRRTNFPVYTKNITPPANGQENVLFMIATESPTAVIIYPEQTISSVPTTYGLADRVPIRKTGSSPTVLSYGHPMSTVFSEPGANSNSTR